MIKFNRLEKGQQLKVKGPDETGKIARGIVVTVVAVRNESVTVKDDNGKEWKFHYAHGAEQLDYVVKPLAANTPPAPPVLNKEQAADGEGKPADACANN